MSTDYIRSTQFAKFKRKCLKCGKEFETLSPKHNRLCTPCNTENSKLFVKGEIAVETRRGGVHGE